MKSFKRKQEDLKKLDEKLPKSKITIFTSFSRADEKGLSVSQMQVLKRSLRELDAEYFVTKKTLIDIALKHLKKKGIDVFGMAGSIGLITGGVDPYAVSKKAYEFSKKNKELHFEGAIFEDEFIDTDAFLEIAKMPSRDDLITKLLAMMMYPLTSMAIVLDQIAKQKEASAQ